MTERLPERFLLDRFETPIGTALVVTDEDGNLRFFDWSDHEDRLRRLVRRYYGYPRAGWNPGRRRRRCATP